MLPSPFVYIMPLSSFKPTRNSSILSSEIGFDDYVFYRKDCSAAQKGLRWYPDCCPQNSLCVYFTLLRCCSVMCWLKFVLLIRINPSMKIFICAIYIPPQLQTIIDSFFTENFLHWKLFQPAIIMMQFWLPWISICLTSTGSILTPPLLLFLLEFF